MVTARPSMPTADKLFIAGSTGATGRTLVRLATKRGVDIVPHVRPASAKGRELHPQSAVCDLQDQAALDAALTGCTAIVQLLCLCYFVLKTRLSGHKTLNHTDKAVKIIKVGGTY